MEQKKIDRISELGRKSREQPLTEAEKAEQAALRAEYIRDMKASLRAQLNATVVVEPDGTRRKLRPRS